MVQGSDRSSSESGPGPAGVAVSAAVTLVLWASVYSAVKVGLEGFTAWQLAFLRLAVASALLGLYAVLARPKMPTRRQWPGLALIGFVGFALYLILLNTGQQTVAAGTAAFIISATPALAALLSVVFLKEALRPFGFLGVAASFCGVSVIVFSRSQGLHLELSIGSLVLVFAALAHAAHFVLQKAFLKDVTPFQVTVVPVWAGTAFLLPFAPETAIALVQAPSEAVIAAVYLGALPSALAYVTWAIVLRRMQATHASNLLTLIPPLAVLIGAVWLGEQPTLLVLCGGTVALCGVVLVQTMGRADR